MMLRVQMRLEESTRYAVAERLRDIAKAVEGDGSVYREEVGRTLIVDPAIGPIGFFAVEDEPWWSVMSPEERIRRLFEMAVISPEGNTL